MALWGRDVKEEKFTVLAEINIQTDLNVHLRKIKQEEAFCEVKLVTQINTEYNGEKTWETHRLSASH